MAGYQDWMNPNPQAANMDRLLNARAGVMGEREQTRERVEPQWQLPWQGPEGFVTDIPGNAGGDQWQERTDFPGDPLRMENQLIPRHLRPEAEFDPATGQMRVKRGNEMEGLQYDIGIDGNTESFSFDNQLTPGGMEAFRRREGLTPEIPQTQRPARPVVPFPEGQSMNTISDIFKRGVTGLSNFVGRGIDQLIPPAY